MAEAELRIVLAQVDADHQAPLAHLLDLAHLLHLREPLREQPDLRLQADQRPLPLEHVERGDRRSAGKRVARVGVAVEEGLELGMRAEEGLVDALARQRRRKRHVPAGQSLCDAEQVGGDPLLLAGEHRAGAAESRGDLVADQQHAVTVAETPNRAEIPGRVGEHPCRSLDERLEHDRGDLLLAHREQPGDVVDVAGLGAVGVEEERAEGGVEEGHSPDGDGPDGVPVVCVLQADERGLPHVLAASVLPVLERHLEGDLDGCRSRVRVEDPVQPGGSDLDEAGGELRRAGVGEAQHGGVGDTVQLLAHRLIDRGMAMPVDVAPKR